MNISFKNDPNLLLIYVQARRSQVVYKFTHLSYVLDVINYLSLAKAKVWSELKPDSVCCAANI